MFWNAKMTPAMFARLGPEQRMHAALRGFGLGRMGVSESALGAAGAQTLTTLRRSDAMQVFPRGSPLPQLNPMSAAAPVPITPTPGIMVSRVGGKTVQDSTPSLFQANPRRGVQTTGGDTTTFAPGTKVDVTPDLDTSANGESGDGADVPVKLSTIESQRAAGIQQTAAQAAAASSSSMDAASGFFATIPTWVKVVGGLGVVGVLLYKFGK